jgi:hypothetical protein
MWTRMILLFFGLITTAFIVQAQTWNELFKQKSTQKKYLIEQIAALRVYGGTLKKGYDGVHSGLNAINDVTGAEYKLHRDFNSSLASVSPFIRADPRVAEIIIMKQSIKNSFDELIERAVPQPAVQAYINTVRKKLDDECLTDVQGLVLVTTSGKLKMKDDERIKRLNQIHDSMEDKLAFIQHFSRMVSVLEKQQYLEQVDVQRLELLLNLKKQP